MPLRGGAPKLAGSPGRGNLGVLGMVKKDFAFGGRRTRLGTGRGEFTRRPVRGLHVVPAGPVLDNLAVGDAPEVDEGPRCGTTGRRYAG